MPFVATIRSALIATLGEPDRSAVNVADNIAVSPAHINAINATHVDAICPADCTTYDSSNTCAYVVTISSAQFFSVITSFAIPFITSEFISIHLAI